MRDRVREIGRIPSDVMEVVIHAGTTMTDDQITDPGGDKLTYVQGSQIVVGVAAAVNDGDTLEWRLLTPAGSLSENHSEAFRGKMRRRTAAKGFTLGSNLGRVTEENCSKPNPGGPSDPPK